jgi:ketosteroid isomerase-like protein
MKARVVAAVVLAVSICSLRAIHAAGQTSMPDKAAVEAQIGAEDLAVGKAIATRDFAALDRYWSPAMIVNGPTNRIVSREQVIESMHHGGLNYTSLKGTTEYFTIIQGVAIKMMHEDVVMADGPMAGKHLVRRSTNVLQRSGDDWVLIARQATYVGFDGAILGGTVTTAYAPPAATPETTAIHEQIEANGRAVGHAIVTQDFEALKKVWSPEMVVNSPGNNILTREQVFAAMREDKLKYSSVKTYSDAFKVFGDVAIEMGHEDIVMANGPMAGQPLKRRYTNVWQKTGDGWVQIARQATYVGVDGGAVYGHPDPSLNR